MALQFPTRNNPSLLSSKRSVIVLGDDSRILAASAVEGNEMLEVVVNVVMIVDFEKI